jgi:hypothetical protein
MFVSTVILQVGPVLSSGRALHRVTVRGDPQPGDDGLAARMRHMTVGECRCKD